MCITKVSLSILAYSSAHLQSAESTLLIWFLQVAVHEIETMNDTNIETTSGLRINIRKGIMVGVRMELWEEVNKLAYIINCKVDQFPIKYLVLPLGDIQDQNWEGSDDSKKEEEISYAEKKAPFFKRPYTLIKGLMENCPVYYLSLFKIPTTI